METAYSLSLIVIIIVLLGVILKGLMTVGKAKAR
jgi:cbb3-type cytochrome oxidase subunit 3